MVVHAARIPPERRTSGQRSGCSRPPAPSDIVHAWPSEFGCPRPGTPGGRGKPVATKPVTNAYTLSCDVDDNFVARQVHGAARPQSSSRPSDRRSAGAVNISEAHGPRDREGHYSAQRTTPAGLPTCMAHIRPRTPDRVAGPTEQSLAPRPGTNESGRPVTACSSFSAAVITATRSCRKHPAAHRPPQHDPVVPSLPTHARWAESAGPAGGRRREHGETRVLRHTQ